MFDDTLSSGSRAGTSKGRECRAVEYGRPPMGGPVRCDVRSVTFSDQSKKERVIKQEETNATFIFVIFSSKHKKCKLIHSKPVQPLNSHLGMQQQQYYPHPHYPPPPPPWQKLNQ